MKNVFKIKRKTDGLYSTGGTEPKFSKQGKTWTQAALKLHFGMFDSKNLHRYYSDCEIVEYELTEKENSTIDIEYFSEKLFLKALKN